MRKVRNRGRGRSFPSGRGAFPLVDGDKQGQKHASLRSRPSSALRAPSPAGGRRASISAYDAVRISSSPAYREKVARSAGCGRERRELLLPGSRLPPLLRGGLGACVGQQGLGGFGEDFAGEGFGDK